ncbi:hypothetical protein [Streptomyces sp. NPDC002205]|uniref:hypothetical protein n=1 Tax=unclassified Streptomyces TaxID=2593676 RepID=UPI0033210F37
MFFRTPAEPPEPTAPDLDEMEESDAMFANDLLLMREGLAPAFDAADGMRADLIARGWSDQAAEAITITWLQRIVTNLAPLVGDPE